MRIILSSLILLLASCSGEDHTIILDPLLEIVKCESRSYAYTECRTFNDVEKIVSILPKKAVDCIKDTDYYLLDASTIVVRNNCSASFILQIKR